MGTDKIYTRWETTAYDCTAADLLLNVILEQEVENTNAVIISKRRFLMRQLFYDTDTVQRLPNKDA